MSNRIHIVRPTTMAAAFNKLGFVIDRVYTVNETKAALLGRQENDKEDEKPSTWRRLNTSGYNSNPNNYRNKRHANREAYIKSRQADQAWAEHSRAAA